MIPRGIKKERKRERKGKRKIGRNIERGIAMIATGSSVWITTYRFVRGRGWRMFLRRVFVRLIPCLRYISPV